MGIIEGAFSLTPSRVGGLLVAMVGLTIGAFIWVSRLPLNFDIFIFLEYELLLDGE